MANSGELSLGVPLAALMLAIALAGVAVGTAIKGHALGLWINNQNRFSLARAQVSLWTVVILGGFATMALYQAALLAAAAQFDTAVRLAPDIPYLLYAPIGVTFASTMASKFILSVKDRPGDVDLAPSGTTTSNGPTRFSGLIAPSTGLDRNAAPTQASALDFVNGEETVNADEIDISHFQNVVITLILVFAYGGELFATVRHVAPSVVLGALQTPQDFFRTMPDITGSFPTLLVISHAAYFVTKASSKTGAS